MSKYINADLLRKEIEFAKTVYEHPNRVVHGVADAFRQDGRAAMCDDILKKIDSLQQDDTQVDKMLCSQTWWEEQGWIMIPPDATIKGIDSLLKQVRKKLQQEQQEVDLKEEFSEKMPIQEHKNIFEGPYQTLYELGLNAKKED